MLKYNTERSHQEKPCKGRTPMATLREDKKCLYEKNLEEKMLAAQLSSAYQGNLATIKAPTVQAT